MRIVSTRLFRRIISRPLSPSASIPTTDGAPPIAAPVVVVGVKGERGEPGEDGAPATLFDPGDLTLAFDNGLL